MMGTLEIILLSPIELSRMLLYSSLWAYTFTTFRLLCYLFFGALLFDLNIGNGDPLTAAVFLALSVLCFAPLGIISAAVIVVFKKGMWFQTLVSAASFFLGGVAFPINVLPEWIRPFGFYVPMTHSVNGLRHALLNGQSLAELYGEALFLLVFALIVTPIGVFIFKLAISRAKVKGSLTHY
jgi:ABC-2 type transport system permease protein